ncbi:MAG TPA: MFS transporter [Pseudonocardiaceae bacterium]|jgi:MFS family permease|nr:MFS transporter [Pseudonocardiaceae bacterium]
MATPTATATDRRAVVRWRNAVLVIFALQGLAIATWLSRNPTIRDLLHVRTGELGLIVFGLSVGALVGITLSSHVLAALGGRHTIVLTSAVNAGGLAVAGLGASTFTSPAVVVVGLCLFGIGGGSCDVAMNVEGAANERALGRSVMPLFHASFSIGTVVGAGVGALMEWLDVPVVAHTAVTAVVILVGTVFAVRYLPADVGQDTGEEKTTFRERLSSWTERRTLLIGLVVLGFAFAEGSANDWLALAMVDGHHVANAVGSVVFGVFVAAMTIGRVLGVRVLDRYGRVVVLRATAVLAVGGLLAVIFVGPVAVVVCAVVLWGLGASLGFPVGMSAAADDPRAAAGRVSAVATMGYLAFLVGPPVIGLLGQNVGLLRALLLVVSLIAVAGLVSGAARPPHEEGSR